MCRDCHIMSVVDKFELCHIIIDKLAMRHLAT